MTRRLKLEEVLKIHQEILNQSGGSTGIRDLGALKSSISQPFQSFGDTENFPTVEEKAAAYAYFITQNHPFVDGNKRVAHASMEIFLNLNGIDLQADVDSQEELMLSIASGETTHEELTEWLKNHTTEK